MKNCSNCKHRDKFITEEPCFTCKYTEKWEPKDEDDNESGSDRNINYIYGMVSPDIQRSLDLAIKVLKEKEGGFR